MDQWINDQWKRAKFAQQRLRDEYYRKPKPLREIQIPRTDAGAPVPIIYGRVRVRAPILAWMGPAVYETTGGRNLLHANMFYVLGSGFPHTDTSHLSENKLWALWMGENKSTSGFNKAYTDLTGNGNNEVAVQSMGFTQGNVQAVGDVEFLNGRPDQVLALGGNPTNAGSRMRAGLPHGDSLAEAQIPGYRGFLSVCMFQVGSFGGFNHGDTEDIAAYQFEASSLYTNHPDLGLYARVGFYDSNPIVALYDLANRCGITAAEIDMPSFVATAITCRSEELMYSRCIADASAAADHIEEILRYVDGTFYKDPYTQLWRVKLIRGDYDPNAVFHLNKANCWELQGFAAGNWANIPTTVEVVFESRDKDYADDSAIAQNQANATTQGIREPLVLEYRCICYPKQAGKIAARELSARSRPLAKCRAIVDRTALRVMPGDAVKVTMERYNVAGRIFRVTGVEHGTLEDGKIALDLIEDHFFVWRQQSPLPPDFGGYGIDGLDLGLRP